MAETVVVTVFYCLEDKAVPAVRSAAEPCIAEDMAVDTEVRNSMFAGTEVPESMVADTEVQNSIPVEQEYSSALEEREAFVPDMGMHFAAVFAYMSPLRND